LVRALGAQGKRTVLTTNGRLLDRPKLDALRASGLSAVQIPILAGTPSIHNQLSRVRCWREAVFALALSVELGLHAVGVFVATASNISELSTVVDVLEAIGVQNLIVNELQPVGSASQFLDQLAVSPVVFSRTIDEVARLNPTSSLNIKIVRHASSFGTITNSRVWTRWSITSSGELKLCNLSSKTLGKIEQLTDEEIERLAEDYRHGNLKPMSAYVDNCACFDLIYSGRDASAASMANSQNSSAADSPVETLGPEITP